MEPRPAPSSPAAPSEAPAEKSLLAQLTELGASLPATEVPTQGELAQVVGALVHYSATGSTEPIAPEVTTAPAEPEPDADDTEKDAEIAQLRSQLAAAEAASQPPSSPSSPSAPAAPTPEPPASA